MKLAVENLTAGYGAAIMLSGLSFQIGDGEIVTILGRNGSGRSTTCKAIMGLLPKTGRVLLDGRDITHLSSHAIAHAGLGYIPEEREVFKTLTVEENLQLGVKRGPLPGKPWSFEEVYAAFPRLAERRGVKAGRLSGGEQQMLSMFRTILGNPGIVLVDEPTEGLAPMIVDSVRDTLLALKARGASILLMEQKLAMALEIADRILVMGHGHIVFDGTPAAFRADDDIRRRWLEVA